MKREIKKAIALGTLRLMGWRLGGIRVEREHASGMVDSLVRVLRQAVLADESCIILIPPEGTRRPVAQWKKGFYHASGGANVPFVLGYVDYRRREAGLGPVVHPSGDYERDLEPVYRFYEGIGPKHPDNYISPLAQSF